MSFSNRFSPVGYLSTCLWFVCARMCVCTRASEYTGGREEKRAGGKVDPKYELPPLLKPYQILCVTPDKLSDHHMIYLSPLEATRHEPLCSEVHGG